MLIFQATKARRDKSHSECPSFLCPVGQCSTFNCICRKNTYSCDHVAIQSIQLHLTLLTGFWHFVRMLLSTSNTLKHISIANCDEYSVVYTWLSMLHKKNYKNDCKILSYIFIWLNIIDDKIIKKNLLD